VRVSCERRTVTVLPLDTLVTTSVLVRTTETVGEAEGVERSESLAGSAVPTATGSSNTISSSRLVRFRAKETTSGGVASATTCRACSPLDRAIEAATLSYTSDKSPLAEMNVLAGDVPSEVCNLMESTAEVAS
jgi:hypothetical protein